MTRIEALQRRLHKWDIDSLLIENPVDLFYLTQLSVSRGRLFVRKDGAQFIVDGRYIGEASLKAPCPVSLLEKGKGFQGRTGFDSGWTTVAAFEALKAEAPHASFVPIAKPLREQRLIKDAHEIEALRKAARVTWAGIQHIRPLFKEGVSEEEIALEFEFFVRRQGASGLSFPSIIAFGENSAYPHHRASSTRLKKNQIILVDVGAVVDRYCGDVTRVFFFGEPDEELGHLYELVRQANLAARQCVRSGESVGAMDHAARAVFSENGVEALFSHSLGHGIGIEGHEYPIIRFDGEDREQKIVPGMVFTIEPGLYRAGLGGIRLEDTGLVTEKGFESFYPELSVHSDMEIRHA